MSDPQLDRFLAHRIEGSIPRSGGISASAGSAAGCATTCRSTSSPKWSVLISRVVGYGRMVMRDGWSVEAYQRWFREAVTTLVLRPDGV